MAAFLIVKPDRGDSTSGQELSGDLSISDAMEFEEFELYWVGGEIAGLPITHIIHRTSRNSVSFSYGDCESTTEESGCALPLTVIVEPTCTRREVTPDGIDGGERGEMRGVPVRDLKNGTVVIWTQDVTVLIAVPAGESPVDPLDAVNSLTKVGTRDDSTEAPADLPQPDFSACGRSG